MIHDLKPYPAYKDSGVPWLGQVPEHWEIRRTKTVLRERSDKGYPDEPLLAATQTKGVVRKDQYENRTVLALKDLHLLKLVCVGDFVISLRSFQGGIEYAREHGIISPAYTILYPIDNRLQGYLALLFKSKPYIENLSLFITGIREGQNIDYQKLSRSEIPLPPLPEQSVIARYLDYMDRRIRRYIHAKQKLIKLLEEQKKAIIHRAVTRGLDPNVKLKPSGVEWLGDVPEGWTVERLKYTSSLKGRIGFHGLSSSDYRNEGILVVSGVNFTNWSVDWNQCNRVSEEWYEKDKNIQLQNGDFLITKDGTIGKTAIVDSLTERAVLNSGVILVRPKPPIRYNNKYIQYVINSNVFSSFIEIKKTGATIHHLYEATFNNFSILLPPILDQYLIVDHLDKETSTINNVITSTNAEISLLREYRTRLISDVVTGKLDVREAAASLPDEVEEPEVLEDESAEDGDNMENDLEDVSGEEEA